MATVADLQSADKSKDIVGEAVALLGTGKLSSTVPGPPYSREVLDQTEVAAANVGYSLNKAMVEFLAKQVEGSMAKLHKEKKMHERDLVFVIRPKLLLIQDLRNRIRKLKQLQTDVGDEGSLKMLCYLNSLIGFEDYLMKDVSPYLENLVEMKKLRSAVPGLELNDVGILTSETAKAFPQMMEMNKLVAELSGVKGGKGHKKRQSRRKGKGKKKSRSRSRKVKGKGKKRSARSRASRSKSPRSARRNRSVPKVIAF